MVSLALYRKTLALAVCALGCMLLVGGLLLLWLGGAVWYCLTGTALFAIGVLLWRRSRWASHGYAVMMAVTIFWSMVEVGWDAWGLLPRLLLLMILWWIILLPPIQRELHHGPPLRWIALRWVLPLTLVFVAVSCLLTFQSFRTLVTTHDGIGSARMPQGAGLDDDWLAYGKDHAGTRYSPLSQIDRNNVGKLRLAWQFRTGDAALSGQKYNFEATPLKAGRWLYLCSPSGHVFALDAVTGAQRWHFDPHPQMSGVSEVTCRGVSYFDGTVASHSDTVVSTDCPQRIFVGTPDGLLHALDAQTGAPCQTFAEHGVLDLKRDLGEVAPGGYAVTSPPLIVGRLLVVGAKIQDNYSIDMPSGVVRAFDVVTGQRVWAWDMGQVSERATGSQEDIFTRSTPNAWAPFAADAVLGLIYVPTGNPAFDFWGGKRRPFDHQYGSSLVALDQATGVVRWSFQVTHHDVWDNDVSAQPLLVDVRVDNLLTPAVVVGTKQGQVFVLDRRTGKPLVSVQERPVPQGSDVGERLSATQPFSGLMLLPGPERLSEASMWGLSPVDQLWCRIQFRRARYEGPYTPPGLGKRSIVYPGMFGGIEWGGMSVDPETGTLFVAANAMPFMVSLSQTRDDSRSDTADVHLASGEQPPPADGVRGTPYNVSFYGFLSPLKIPCMNPPWSKLYAIDLNSAVASPRSDNPVRWQRPVGTVADSGPAGLRSGLPLLVGTPQVGGSVVTGGGLVFSAGTLDNYLRAYDQSNGSELWRARLPAGGQATPMTYAVDGRQYVVIAAGGHGVLGTRSGDYVQAYSLSD